MRSNTCASFQSGQREMYYLAVAAHFEEQLFVRLGRLGGFDTSVTVHFKFIDFQKMVSTIPW